MSSVSQRPGFRFDASRLPRQAGRTACPLPSEKCQKLMGKRVQLPFLPLSVAEVAIAELWVQLEVTGAAPPDISVDYVGPLVRITVSGLPLSHTAVPLDLWAMGWREAPGDSLSLTMPRSQPAGSTSVRSTSGSRAIRTRATALSKRSVAPRRAFSDGPVDSSNALSKATRKFATSPVVASRRSAVNPVRVTPPLDDPAAGRCTDLSFTDDPESPTTRPTSGSLPCSWDSRRTI